jgi:hypothetical protein
MEYFGSAVLLADVSSSPVLADLPKIIDPSIFSSMTTSVVPNLMMSPFCHLLGGYRYMPPCRIGRPLRPSGLAILLGLRLVTGLRGTQSVLYWRCQPVEHRCLGCPQNRVLWHPKRIWWHAPHLVQNIWRWYVCILIWHRWIWVWWCPCRHVRY